MQSGAVGVEISREETIYYVPFRKGCEEILLRGRRCHVTAVESKLCERYDIFIVFCVLGIVEISLYFFNLEL